MYITIVVAHVYIAGDDEYGIENICTVADAAPPYSMCFRSVVYIQVEI